MLTTALGRSAWHRPAMGRRREPLARAGGAPRESNMNGDTYCRRCHARFRGCRPSPYGPICPHCVADGVIVTLTNPPRMSSEPRSTTDSSSLNADLAARATAATAPDVHENRHRLIRSAVHSGRPVIPVGMKYEQLGGDICLSVDAAYECPHLAPDEPLDRLTDDAGLRVLKQEPQVA